MNVPIIELRVDGEALDASSMRSATLHREESAWSVTVICDRSSVLHARFGDGSAPREIAVLAITPAGHYSGRAGLVSAAESSGDVLEMTLAGLGELEPRPHDETHVTGRAWLAGAQSIPVSALEVNSRPLEPSSLRAASLTHNECQWFIEIECDWSSDLADEIRRNGMLRGVGILATTESGVYSGEAWLGFAGEPAEGVVAVAAYGVGAPRVQR